MDSLLANYASSDEEDHESQPQPPPPPAVRMPPPKPAKLAAEEEKHDDSPPKSTPKRGGLFNSLPPPKSSLFNSLPPPKSESFPNPKPRAESKHQGDVGGRDEEVVENSKPKSSSSSLFSSLPQPKSASSAASKRVVQFRPPSTVNPNDRGVDDEDDSEDEGEKERQRKKMRESVSTVSPASFLSSIPAPRHSATLGAMPSALGSGRRSIVETDNWASGVNTVGAAGGEADVNSNVGHSNDQPSEVNYDYASWGSGSESHTYYADSGMNSDVGHDGHQSHEIYGQSSNVGGENYGYYSGYGAGTGDANSVSTTGSDAVVDYSYGSEHVEYANYGGSYVDYGNNAHHGYNYPNAAALPEVSREAGNALPLPGRRGRKDNPPEIVEVKQDELMKNRPREDQVKMTGIAFGPAYQPASTKGKPTKLHKRKHQIGSLYFDMKQKEMELAERRSRGFLTKAQTQAKYGW